MLKLYYDGWRTVGKPITVGKIKRLVFELGEDPNSVINSWVGSRAYAASNSLSEDGDGFNEFIKVLGDGKELFTDPDLSDSIGVTVKKKGSEYSFMSGNTSLYGIPLQSPIVNTSLYELCSIYDGDTYIDYLKSMALHEKAVMTGDQIDATLITPSLNPLKRGIPPMSISPLAAPVVLHVKDNSAVNNRFGYICNTSNRCLSFATLYKIYFKKNLVEVDMPTADTFAAIEPAVAYNPANIVVSAIGKKDADTVYSYEDNLDFAPIIISNAKQDNPEVPGTVKDVTCYKEEKTSKSFKSITIEQMTLTTLPYVQLGTNLSSSKIMPTSGTRLADVFDSNAYLKASDSDKWLETPYWFLTQEYFSGYSQLYLVETSPIWNVSKVLKDKSDKNFGLYGDKNKLPLFVFGCGALAFSATGSYNVFDVALPIMFPSADNEVSKITGAKYSQWLYNGDVVDAGDKPVPPADIPDDNGNGGFNNSDYLGGNGSWQDSTTDMSYNKSNPLWYTPNNLGLDGNYDIVKLSRSSVELLASQTWTTDGWLAYLTKMSNISRAGDGVAEIKTCFAEIPTTGAAQVAAIAGFGLNKPIPCERVNQYNQFDMGTVNVPVYFGGFLDYSPYTEIVLELPFAQPVKIPPEVVVGQNINLTLSVDLMSSSAMYIITCGGRLLAQVPANIFINIPFAASEYTEGAISALAGYVASAGNIGSNVATSTQQKLDKGKAVMNPVAAGFEAAAAPAAAIHETASRGESRNITQISQGGGGGAIGAMGLKYATLKITRPYVTIPPRYYELQGCPSGFVKRVGDCKGYLEVEQIYGSIPCNTDEFNAIVSQLKGGIFP